jgi:putative radical SAM enzyme (TIGR03279 family)
MYTEIFETLYPINSPKKERGVRITAVDPFSIGEQIGLKPGDRITAINGHELRDFLDFQFYAGSEDEVAIEVAGADGRVWNTSVEIAEGEIWGLDFDYFAPRQCANDCIFCFCNQNPAGARDSLFFKDEDIRLSFLHGNYTTMSSISKAELDRIVEQRLSPQYVSVHATDPDVRRYLLGRKRPDRVLDKLRYLNERGIELHAQIVLCPTINDGDVLKRTVEDLAELYPGLVSIAVVPVVVTKLHNYRHLITPVTGDYARDLIETVRRWQRDYRKRLKTTFVFLADEFYLRAEVAIPGRDHYGDYPQIEDGVGMVRRFISDSKGFLRRASSKKIDLGLLHGTLCTGELFYPILSGLVDGVNARFGSRLKTVAVTNGFFGEEVTVAGLLAGRDFLTARERFEGNFVVIPGQACLRSGQVFLDDLTLADLRREFKVPVLSGGATLEATLRETVVELETLNRL